MRNSFFHTWLPSAGRASYRKLFLLFLRRRDLVVTPLGATRIGEEREFIDRLNLFHLRVLRDSPIRSARC